MKIYIKENFRDIYALFSEKSIESFLLPQILELSSQIFTERTDIFARFLDRVLLDKNLAKKPVFLGLLASLFRLLSVKFFKKTRENSNEKTNENSIKTTNNLILLMNFELKTLENTEEFIDDALKEADKIGLFERENSMIFSRFEANILMNFSYFNQINRLIYSFIAFF